MLSCLNIASIVCICLAVSPLKQVLNYGAVDVYEYRGLQRSYSGIAESSTNKALERSVPDATMIIRKDLDKRKPLHIVFYDHGFYDSNRTVVDRSRLAEQMSAASTNTILVIPEWQNNPKGWHNSESSHVYKQNFFREQLSDIFKNTEALEDKTLDDIEDIMIVTHSAGYNAAKAQIYKNGFEAKVTTIAVLDSNYDPHAYDKWVEDNAREFVSGTKHMVIVYTEHSPEERYKYAAEYGAKTSWKEMVERNLRIALAKKVESPDNLIIELPAGGAADPGALNRRGIIFKKHTESEHPDKNPHMGMTTVYLRKLLEAQKMRTAP